MDRLEIPGLWVQWRHFRVAPVQVGEPRLRAMLLVSGRSAVRIRSPALGFRTNIPTSCLPRARSARLLSLPRPCQFSPGSLAHRIGQGALPLVRGVQIDQRGALAVVPHPDHEFPGIRARIGCELIAGMAQVAAWLKVDPQVSLEVVRW
jgi:hypothetical protein